MAPEYCFQGHFSTKSDIYSLGVMLLEILTSVRWSRDISDPDNSISLKSYVRYAYIKTYVFLLSYQLIISYWVQISANWENATLADKLAKNVDETYTEKQEKTLSNILHIALLCVDPDPKLRPKISDVRDCISFSNHSNSNMSHIYVLGS